MHATARPSTRREVDCHTLLQLQKYKKKLEDTTQIDQEFFFWKIDQAVMIFSLSEETVKAARQQDIV